MQRFIHRRKTPCRNSLQAGTRGSRFHLNKCMDWVSLFGSLIDKALPSEPYWTRLDIALNEVDWYADTELDKLFDMFLESSFPKLWIETMVFT